jgi:TPR repeat protein
MKMKWCVTGFLLFILCAGIQLHAQQSDTNSIENIKTNAERGDATAQYKIGAIYYRGQGVPQDFTEAVKWFRKAAEQKFAAAQYDLGVCYRDGQGMAKDDVEAVNWFRKAAEQNLAIAQYNLGVCYGAGQGVAKDAVEAVKWYRKAAEQNLAYAESNLGACYEQGNGVVKDYVEAVKWYRKAAGQNYVIAEYDLGSCYANGEGVDPDAAEAVKWYRKAAEQNYAIAQCNLGVCCANGQGVAKDYVEAYKWLNLASAQGDKVAKNNLPTIESWMTPEQIAEAQRLSRDFFTSQQTNPKIISNLNPIADKQNSRGQSNDSMVKPVPPAPVPVQVHKNTIPPELTQEDIDYLKAKGIDPNTVSIVSNQPASSADAATSTPPGLKNAGIWMDNFLGTINAVIAADVISMKPEALKFRLFGKDYNYSGHYTVMLNTPRQHKNPYFGFGSPETAKLVILEKVGGDAFPLQNATIWEKSNGFIVVVALDKEWIHSGTYTIQN